MSDRIGAAIIGLGWWGKRLAGFVDGSPEIEIVRGVEPNASSLEGFSDTCGFPITASLEDALSDPKVDAVILATPHTLHEGQIAAAVKAGKHVFCEKPLALTRQSAESSVALCKQAGLVLGIGHERRFEPPMAEVLAMCRSGELGTILQIESNFSHDRFTALPADNWRMSDTNAPAGGMTATGIHIFDLATAILGAADSVKVFSKTLASSIPNGDSTAALARFKTGATVYVTAMLATPFVSRFAIFGSKGWIEIRDKAHVESPEGWRVEKCFREGEVTIEDVPVHNAARDNLEAFARAVAGNAPYPISTDDMIANTALMEAIFRSAASGREEQVA